MDRTGDVECEPRVLAKQGAVDVKKLDVLAAVLVVVGALNWGLVAIAKFDLVAALFGMRFGETSALTATVYGLVGLAGVYQGLGWKGVQRRWHSQPVLHSNR